MTVSSTSNRVVYSGNGATTVFPFAFKVLQAADLVVTYTDATGTDYTLSPSQYAATGFGLDAGGTVTYPLSGSPIASGTGLTIQRSISPTQPTSISNQGAMWPQVIEAAFDRVVMIVQGMLDSVGRSLKISTSDGTALNPLPTATQRANGVLGFDAGGQPVIVQNLAAAPVSTWVAANLLLQTSANAILAALGAAGSAINNSFTAINDFTGGRIKVPTRAAGDNGPDAASTAFLTRALRSYLAGCTLSNDATTPNTKLDVAAGVFMDDTNASLLVGAGGVIDFTTTGVNGLDTGALAINTTYHVFGIGKSDGTVAYYASTSLTPTLPTGYTLKRRLGSVLTDGSAHLVPFTQNGDEFLFLTVLTDLTTTLTAATPKLLALRVPTGIVVNGLFSALAQNGVGAVVLLYSPAQSGGAGFGLDGSHPASIGAVVGSSGNYGAGDFNIRTNTSGQIYGVANPGVNPGFAIATKGWIDTRGRFA